MTLTDTGPLVALLDSGDADHARCVATAATLSRTPLRTTWPCFTEAMYLLGDSTGHRGQAALWNLRSKGALVLHESSTNEADRMAALMAQYRDTPMDLADASLVAAAEVLGIRRVFTLDSDFYVYRIGGKDAFEVVP